MSSLDKSEEAAAQELPDAHILWLNWLEVIKAIRDTGGQFTAGYAPLGPDQIGRWEVRIMHAGVPGSDSKSHIGVGPSFAQAFERSITSLQRG